jgi:hypothetical protein
MSDVEHIRLVTEGGFEPGDNIERLGETMRVTKVSGTLLTVRRLRWYERAWLFIAARLKP